MNFKYFFLCILIGFVLSKNMYAQKGPTLDDLFAMSLEELMNVKVVTAGKTMQKVSDVPASVVVITRNDIETFGYSSLDEIIANVTGYYTINNWNYTYSVPGVRGFFSQLGTGVIILINGVSQLRKGIESYSLRESNVPVECIDRIEIIRGPMSVMYGTGAFYGVINIITDKTSTNNKKGQISASAGSLKTNKTCFSLSGDQNDIKYSFNGGYRSSYDRNISFSELTSDLTQWQVADAQKNTDGRLEGWDKYFDFSLDVKSFFLKLTYNEMMQEIYGNIASTDDGNSIENLKLNIMFGYKKKILENLNIKSSFRYNTLNNLQIVNFWESDYYGNEDLRARSYEAEIQVNYSPFDKFKITSGLTQNAMTEYYQLWDYTKAGNFYKNHRKNLSKDDNITTTALFFQSDYLLFKKMKLITGCRLEKMSDYGLEMSYGSDTTANNMRIKEYGKFKNEGLVFIPRVALIYYLNNTNIVKWFYGEAIKHPAFSENVYNLVDIGKYGYLKSEKIRTFELNYTSSPVSNFNICTSFFHNELNNLIGRVYNYSDPDNLITYQANGGKYVTNGTEVILNIYPFENFQINLSGSYQKTKDKRKGYEDIKVAYSPEFLGYLGLSYKINYISLALLGNYVDNMESFWDGPPLESLGGARVGAGSKAYFVLGSNIHFNNLFKTAFYMNIKISNLLNKKFSLPTSTFNQWIDKGIPGYNRRFLIRIGYKFNSK